jgi:hypothetical protein
VRVQASSDAIVLLLRKDGRSPACRLKNCMRVIYWFKSYSFNGFGTICRLSKLACKGAPLDELKGLSDEIILEEKRIPSRGKYNHIDLIEVAPLEGSLKTYAARDCIAGACKICRSIPTSFDARRYRRRSRLLLQRLGQYRTAARRTDVGLAPYIELRERLGALQRRSSIEVRRPSCRSGYQCRTEAYYRALSEEAGLRRTFSFQYEAPQWVQFQTPMLREVLQIVEGTTFYLDGGGSPRMPEE